MIHIHTDNDAVHSRLILTADLPKASTAGNFLTIVFLLAILMTPRARVTVTTIGRPSGIAATAKLTPVNKHVCQK